MVTITFESHATSFDNENGVASGWFDARLSPTGIEQAKQLSTRYADQSFDAIFTSDLKRAYQTATIAFDFDPKHIFSDWRIRECDYGLSTQISKHEIETTKQNFISNPYDHGESYSQVMERMGSFIADLRSLWDGKNVLVIGHRATHMGFEHFLNNKPLEQYMTEQWQWQPGWHYELQ